MREYKAVIIGAGSIGALKPDKYDNPNDHNNILTMAHAFSAHPQIDLVGIIDTDKEKAQEAAKKWGTLGYTDMDILCSEVDIVAVCTPTDTHYDRIKAAMAFFNPKIIVAEKPFCSNYKEALEVHKVSQYKNIPILVDYIRNFNGPIINLANRIRQGDFGEIYNCRTTYNRGFEHEACHAIALMHLFFGDICEVKQLSYREDINDNPNSVNATVYMACENCRDIVFFPVDGNKYSVFEIDIWTEKGRIVLSDHSKVIKYYGIEEEKTYGDYNTIAQKSYKEKETGLTMTLMNVASSAIHYLETGALLGCTSHDACQVHGVLNYWRKFYD